jgi:nucleotide-binding universal stress UspA family protein
MTEIRSIVAATDLSAPARRAADRAAMLAQATSASLSLVHAVSASALDELRRWLDTGGDIEISILDDVRARMHDLAGELAARYRIDIDEHVVSGRPVDEITNVAEQRRADLIVAGTLGAGMFRNRLVGSTAERVVRKAVRPVLMVRQSPREAYRRVLVAVDLSPWSAPSLEIATAVAPDAHFVLVHCIEVPFEGKLRFAGVDERVIEKSRAAALDDAMRRMAELARRAGIEDTRWTPVAPTRLDPWMQIVRQEQERDCDLVVVGKHGRNAVEELFLGSATNMVIAQGSADVLVSTRKEES